MTGDAEDDDDLPPECDDLDELRAELAGDGWTAEKIKERRDNLGNAGQRDY